MQRHSSGETSELDDVLAVEEPLEIRISGKPLCVTMRTPGDDFDLTRGFLLSEAVIRSRDDIESLRHWGSPNVVRVSLASGVPCDLQKLQRHFYSTSSCGVCGKVSIDALRVSAGRVASGMTVGSKVIASLPERLREQQRLFEQTGSIHAAALFDEGASLLHIREDVGRHNAVDKVIGASLDNGARHRESVLMVSGRLGFEIVQKAVVAGIPVVAAVGGPSSLAVELAAEFGVTLIGFVRDGRFNVYTGSERVRSE
jgi:FdhD protein